MIIALEHIDKSYNGQPVLRDFSLNIDTGSAQKDVLLCGPSGIGKTTLLRILAGLEKPDRGELQIITGEAARGGSGLRMGMVFQENRLCMDFTAEENIRMVCPMLTETAVREAILEILPQEVLGKAAGELSGGEQRRVAILRALLPPSDLLIMDEPFTGLDLENRKRIIPYIFERKGKRPLVLASHETEGLPENLRRILLPGA